MGSLRSRACRRQSRLPSSARSGLPHRRWVTIGSAARRGSSASAARSRESSRETTAGPDTPRAQAAASGPRAQPGFSGGRSPERVVLAPGAALRLTNSCPDWLRNDPHHRSAFNVHKHAQRCRRMNRVPRMTRRVGAGAASVSALPSKPRPREGPGKRACAPEPLARRVTTHEQTRTNGEQTRASIVSTYNLPSVLSCRLGNTIGTSIVEATIEDVATGRVIAS